MAVGKLTHQLSTEALPLLRYGYNNNTQPYGASPHSPPENWGTSKNTFHSANANLNSVLGNGKLNEFMFQSRTSRTDRRELNLPTELFPNGVNSARRQLAPEDRAAQVPVPGRLHWAGAATSSRWARASSTSPLSTSRSRPASRRLHPPRRQPHLPISNITFNGGSAAGGSRRQHPQQAVRVLPPGRLAGHGQADPRPRRPLRLRDRLRLRPGRQSSTASCGPRGARRACPAPASASRTSASRRRRTRTTSRRAPASPMT